MELMKQIQGKLNNSEDVIIRPLQVGEVDCHIMYIQTLVDDKKLFERVLQWNSFENLGHHAADKGRKIDALIEALLGGQTLVVKDDETVCYLFKTEQNFSRSPDEPESEKVVRGSHEGFVETLEMNLHLLRKRIRNENLIVEQLTVGTETNTAVAVLYIDNIANEKVVEKVMARVRAIPGDMAFSPGFIEEYIEENPHSVFPQLLYTERPDRVSAHLVEGRVAVIADGSADAIIMPVSIFSFFQSPDDYHKRPYVGSLFRMLRFISFWGALLFPALYIAVIGFHFEIIPNELITLVKESIETVPFPPFFEVLIMIVTIELIREAGIRLPTSIGQTIGIVGGIIIGESVVNAGLVSNIVVIVVALTAIMSFTIPSYEMGNTIRLLSFPIMVSAALFGFVGVTFSFIILFIHLCKLESYGTPYLSPLVPFSLQGLKDTFIRMPNPMFTRRPEHVHPQKVKRRKGEGNDSFVK